MTEGFHFTSRCHLQEKNKNKPEKGKVSKSSLQRLGDDYLRGWTVGAHSPSVGALIALQQSLVVLCWWHGGHSPSISEAQTLRKKQTVHLTFDAKKVKKKKFNKENYTYLNSS